MTVTLTSTAILAFVLGSMLYVYRFRGAERWAGVREYVRKGWPIFTPINCLLYLFTERRARKPIMDTSQFPELAAIRDNWETIREEAIALHRSEAFDRAKDPDSRAYYDLGFRTFYKYGWSKFYLKWYGTRHRSAQEACPKTLEILDRVPSVKGAMFSVLPVGGKLTRHADPAAASLRYHVGLATPNDDACYINIDGTDYSWRDGDDLLFDETYLHYAHNDSDRDRLILMCDVERPTWIVGRIVNFFYMLMMRATVVPNTEDDRRGLVNGIFSGVSPTVARARKLKTTHPRRYRVLKHTLNAILLLILAGLVVGAIYGLSLLFGLV